MTAPNLTKPVYQLMIEHAQYLAIGQVVMHWAGPILSRGMDRA
jgi:hypothetical protein